MLFFFFCRQKAAYEMLISDWSSDVCSSYLLCGAPQVAGQKFSRPLPRHLVRLTQHRRRMDGRERVCCERRVARPAVVDGEEDSSEARRVGYEDVSTCSSRWETYNYKQKQNLTPHTTCKNKYHR